MKKLKESHTADALFDSACERLRRSRCVEVLRDPDLPFPRSKDAFFAGPAVGHQARDRFAGFRKHNFLAGSGFLDEPREMSLGSLNVEGFHLNQVWSSSSRRFNDDVDYRVLDLVFASATPARPFFLFRPALGVPGARV